MFFLWWWLVWVEIYLISIVFQFSICFLIKIFHKNIIHYWPGTTCGTTLGQKFLRSQFWRFFRCDFEIFSIIMRIMKENCPGRCGTTPVDTQVSTSRTGLLYVTSLEIFVKILIFLNRLQIENCRYLAEYTAPRDVLGLYIDTREPYDHNAPKNSPFWDL